MHTLRTLLSCGFSLAIATAQVNVLTRDYDSGRSGANLAETQLTVANVVPGNFGLVGTFPVDGEIFAQPLYVSGVTIPGQGQHNVLYASTEHNTIYAYDADSAANPNLLWYVNLGPSVPSVWLPSDPDSGPFIDVYPEVGILSTPVIDLQAGVIYVVADTLTASGTLFQLHALDLATGQERMNGPVDISASVAGTGYGSTAAGVLPFDPDQHIQRPALLLANGAVYVGFGSHADYGIWHGWLMSYNAADLSQQLAVYQTTPNGYGGAIWQSGRGLAADNAGNIYFITGNGDFDGSHDFGESMLRLSGNGLALKDWYTPANWQSLAENDVDLSAGPAIVPGTSLLVAGDKTGSVYVVNGSSMGHLDTGNAAQVTQAAGGFIFSFALWGRSDATYIYLIDADGSLKAFRIAGGSISANPVSISNPTVGTARLGMAISANGSAEGTGILWVTTGEYLNSDVPTTLHAFDASNLANEIWNSGMNQADNMNGFAKFDTPTIANGNVYAASEGAVMVYGILPAITTGSPAPVISGVENAASFDQTAISPGEVITIFGTNLGPANPAVTELNVDGTVAMNLADTQVLVNGIPAPLLYAGQGQVNAVVPFEISTTTAQVQVVYLDQASQSFPIAVQTVTPALFSADGSGHGQALAIHLDGTLNSSSEPSAGQCRDGTLRDRRRPDLAAIGHRRGCRRQPTASASIARHRPDWRSDGPGALRRERAGNDRWRNADQRGGSRGSRIQPGGFGGFEDWRSSEPRWVDRSVEVSAQSTTIGNISSAGASIS